MHNEITAGPIALRLAARRPAYTLTIDQRDAVLHYFEAHAASDAVYLFYDGRVLDADEYQRQMTSRTAQLVAIARDGFPIVVGRRAFYRWFVYGHD